MVDPVRSIFPLNMSVILLFVLLVLFHEHIQPTQAYSVALPLAVRSPYLSCWLPQINGTVNATSCRGLRPRHPTSRGDHTGNPQVHLPRP